MNMEGDIQVEKPTRSWLCWIARVISVFVGLFWLFIGIITVIAGARALDWLGIAMLLLIVLSLVCIGVAWRQARLGALLLLLIAFVQGLFAILSARDEPVWAFLVYAGPFLLIGFLFWMCSIQTEKG